MNPAASPIWLLGKQLIPLPLAPTEAARIKKGRSQVLLCGCEALDEYHNQKTWLFPKERTSDGGCTAEASSRLYFHAPPAHDAKRALRGSLPSTLRSAAPLRRGRRRG